MSSASGGGWLEGRLAVLFVLLSLVPLALATAVLEHSETQLIEREVGNHLATAVELKEAAVRGWIEEKQKRVAVIAAQLERYRAAGDDAHAEEEARFLFATVGARDSDLQELLLVDGVRGTILISSEPANEGRFRDDQPYFREGRHRPFVQPLSYALPDEAYAIVVSTPVARPAGGPPDVLAGRLAAAPLLDLLGDRAGLGETGQAYATNRFADVLSASPVGAPRATGPLGGCAATGGGRGTYVDARGQAVYGVWSWDRAVSLCFVAEIAVSEAFAPVFELRRGLVVGLLALGLVMLGLSLYVSRLLAQPVAEQAAAEERLRNVLANLPAGVAELAPDGAVIDANQAFAECRAPDGRPLIVPGDQALARLAAAGAPRPLVEDLREALARGGSVAPQLFTMPAPAGPEHRAGRPQPRELTVGLHSGGGAVGSLLVCVDVTEQKDVERRLLAEFREMDRMKTHFINTAAHELNTPLTPLLIQLHLLAGARGASLTDAQRRSLGIIRQNVERLAQLVGDLLDVARLQAGHLKLQPRAVDLGEALGQAVEEFRGSAAVAGVALGLDAPEGPPARVDPKRLQQVMANLLGNALKFTPAGGRVEVRLAYRGDEAEVRVRDTGVGIAAEDIPRLFQPFVQLDNPMRDKAGGTGLGLHISKGIVERSGGRLWCESAGRGLGATFAFALPLAAPALAASAGGAGPGLPAVSFREAPPAPAEPAATAPERGRRA